MTYLFAPPVAPSVSARSEAIAPSMPQKHSMVSVHTLSPPASARRTISAVARCGSAPAWSCASAW